MSASIAARAAESGASTTPIGSPAHTDVSATAGRSAPVIRGPAHAPHAVADQVRCAPEERAEAIFLHGPPEAGESDPFTFFRSREIEAKLVDEFIHISIGFDLAADLEHAMQVLGTVADLHHAVRGQVIQTLVAEAVLVPMNVEANPRALVQAAPLVEGD